MKIDFTSAKVLDKILMPFSRFDRQSDHCQFFGLLYEHELDDISKHLRVKRVYYGQRFFTQQVGKKKIFLVINGCFKIAENKKLKFVALRGDFFGSVFGSGDGDYAQVISKEAILMTVDEAQFYSWLQRHPRLNKVYFEKVEEKISEMMSWHLNMLRSDAKGRLLLLLKKMVEKQGKRIQNRVTIHALTHDHLAAMIFSTRRTVSRLLRVLAEEGKVTRKANAMHVNVGANCVHQKAVA